jgi:transketolase
MIVSREPRYNAMAARRRLVQMHYESGVGHIGGNLSCLDALLVTFHYFLKPNDHFVLSKGHAAGALYTTLWTLGLITDDDLKTFHRDGTLLAGHPPARGLPRIGFATGSLGHGTSLAAGTALACRLKGDDAKVACLTSDGEWQEGSTWEGIAFAARHGLSNLTVMIDQNGLQGFGTTAEVGGASSLAERIGCLDVDVVHVAGHDLHAISEALEQPSDRTKVIVLHTVKGHGVTFMEDRLEWHYLPLTEEQFVQAQAELAVR